MMQYPNGVHTVLVTPFNEDYSVNYDSIKSWVRRQNGSGVAGLVVLGTTSETPVLKREEQLEIVRVVSEELVQLQSMKFLTVGVGPPSSTDACIEFALDCVNLETKIGAFMVTVPPYNKPQQSGIIDHFQTFCSNEILSQYPVILYNNPGRCALNATPETIADIHNMCPNVVAIKEANPDQFVDVRRCAPTLKLFTGDDKQILGAMINGGSGVISVASNIFPDIICEITKECLENYFSSASEIFYHNKIAELCNALFCETNPAPAKYMMFYLGLYENAVLRKPLQMLSEGKQEVVKLIAKELQDKLYPE